MGLFQQPITLAQIALKSATEVSTAALNIAGEVSSDIVEKAKEIIPEAANQVGKLASEVAIAAKDTGEIVGDCILNAAAQTAQTIPANPGIAVAAVTGAAGIAMVAAPAIFALPALGAVGFGTSGPVAGSIAAIAQSGIGSVVAPSLFATCQSAAMGGYGAATMFGVVQAGGGAIAVAAGAALAQTKQSQ